MILHNINPVIVSIGPLAIRWYSLVYVLGFLGGYFWLHHLAKKKAIKNLTEEIVDQFTIWLIIGVILGGRLFEFIFFQPDVLLTNPLEVLMIWHGGMSFHGGLIGVAIVTYYFTKKYDLSLLALGDALSLPAAAALFLGRIANFVNAELWGKIAQGNPWYCVDYSQNQYVTNPPTGCRHPSQLYESLKNLVIFGVLTFTWQQKRKPGLIMWLFITLYGLFRFVVNIWRDDPITAFGLSTGQLLSLVMFFIGIIALWHTYRK